MRRKKLIPYTGRFHICCSHCRHAKFPLLKNALATERLDQTNRVHISSVAVGENTELVPTGGMPLERSVGKAARHTFATVTMPLPAILCQTCRAKHAGLTVGLLRSEQRSDTRLSNALADHSYRTKQTAVPHRLGPLSTCRSVNMPTGIASTAIPNMPFQTSRVDRWPSLVGLSNALTLT